MFKKKNPVKKLEVKSEDRGEQEIKIKVAPLVKIELHESRINGNVQKPEYRISIGGRDVLMLNSREYSELFSEMLHRMDNDELIHRIAENHMLEHAKQEKHFMLATKGAEEMLKHVLGEEGFAEAMKTFNS